MCENVGPDCNFSSIAQAVQAVSQNDTLILIATRSSGSYTEDTSELTYNNVTLHFAGFVVVTCIIPPCALWLLSALIGCSLASLNSYVAGINLNAGLRLNLEGGPVKFEVDLESSKKRGEIMTFPPLLE